MSHDGPFLSPAAALGAVGQKKIIENVGAKRIVGTELLTLGKVPAFVYYLVDISSICFYANDGSDTWIGGFGQPVAGSLLLRDSLLPFQGQKFYVVEQDVSYTYQGGAWEGGVIHANVMAPSFIFPSALDTLTRGRSHVIDETGNYLLPLGISIPEGDSLAGHAMELVIARGTVGAILVASGADEFIDDAGNTSTSLPLTASGWYRVVFNGTAWEVYFTDIAGFLRAENNLSDVASVMTARANLGVYSTTELDGFLNNKLDKATTIGVQAGITKTGTLGGGNLGFGADFATSEEAKDAGNTVKVLNPSHIPEAVEDATRANRYTNITGLLPQQGESKFLLTKNVDPTKVDYPEFTVVFNDEPYTKTDALTQITKAAGVLSLPNTLGVVVYHVKVDTAGQVSLSLTKPLATSTTESYLGQIVALDGSVVQVAGEDQIITAPWLSSSDYAVRHSPTSLSGGIVTPSAVQGKVHRDSVEVNSESVNWEASTQVPHVRTIGGIDPMDWTYLDDNGAIINPNPTDLVKADELGNGAAVGLNNFSIQILYISTEGVEAVLLGQGTYATITDALAQVENYQPVLPSLLVGALELARWVIKGNQFPGGGMYDLTNPDNFVSVVGSSITGAAVGANASDITSSNVNNSLDSTNLQEQVDALSDRTDWKELTVPATPITAKQRKSVALTAGAYTLPALPAKGISQKVAARGEIQADFAVSGGGEQIVSASGAFPNDTVFRIESFNNGIAYELVSDGTNWVL